MHLLRKCVIYNKHSIISAKSLLLYARLKTKQFSIYMCDVFFITANRQFLKWLFLKILDSITILFQSTKEFFDETACFIKYFEFLFYQISHRYASSKKLITQLHCAFMNCS